MLRILTRLYGMLVGNACIRRRGARTCRQSLCVLASHVCKSRYVLAAGRIHSWSAVVSVRVGDGARLPVATHEQRVQQLKLPNQDAELHCLERQPGSMLCLAVPFVCLGGRYCSASSTAMVRTQQDAVSAELLSTVVIGLIGVLICFLCAPGAVLCRAAAACFGYILAAIVCFCLGPGVV